MQAARERFHERRDLGGERPRHRVQVGAGDPGGHDEQLGVRPVEQREQVLALRFLTAGARRARVARRGVRRNDAPPRRDLGSAKLVPER